MKNLKLLYITTGDIIMQKDMLILNTLNSKIKKIEITVMLRDTEQKGISQVIPFKSICIKEKRKLTFLWKVFCHTLFTNYDVIFFSSPILFPIVLIPARAKKTRILFGYHEFPIATVIDSFNKISSISRLSHIVEGIIRTLENFFIKTANGVIMIPLVEKEMKRVSRYQNNIEVVSNFPSLAVKPRSTDCLNSLVGRHFIIYSGTIASYTGIKLYFELIKRLRGNYYSDIILVLAGKLSGISEEELKTAIKNMQLEDSVVYLGWIPYEELLSIISHAQIGLALFDPNHLKFSYISEGTSRKIYTYMYCGIPVITNPPLGEFVHHEQCGIVIPYNIEELYSAVVNLLRDDTLRRKLGQNGKNAVLTKYNWERESEKVIKVFENMWSIKQGYRK